MNIVIINLVFRHKKNEYYEYCEKIQMKYERRKL